MSVGGGVPKAEEGELFVVVAVKGITGDKLGGTGSRRAVRWAVDNLLPKAGRFVMIDQQSGICKHSTESQGCYVESQKYSGTSFDCTNRLSFPRRVCGEKEMEVL